MKRSNLDSVFTTGACVVAGGVIGAITYRLAISSSAAVWVIAGALIGAVVRFVWPVLRSFAMRHRIADWRLDEVDIHGIKFTSAGAQRRVAWKLFVEIATRISAQPMRDEEGDNGVALKSLYDLFQLARKVISEMEPTPNACGDTLETFALDMLNSDLRFFLSKWHPKWEFFARDGKVNSQAWPDHKQFRTELRQLQGKIQGRARGLALIAGVKNVDRFFQGQSACLQ